MAREFTRPNVGASGRRRLVPMMGIDFIAGNIETKKGPISGRQTGDASDPYGVKPASIGGRTRLWSFINFLQVNPANRPKTQPDQDAMQRRLNFSTARKSALATLRNLSVLTQVMLDFGNGVTRQSVSPNDYATVPGWVMAVRMAQIAAGQTITPETNTWFQD